MARTLVKEPTFQTVKVVPSHSPPAGTVRFDPFIRLTDQPSTQSTPSAVHLPGSNSSASKCQSTGQAHSDLPQTNQPTASTSSANPPASHKLLPSQASSRPFRKDSVSSSESEAESELSDRPPVDLYVEEGELSEDQDVTITHPDQSLSEEQTYRETMRGIQSYMGSSHILDLDTRITPLPVLRSNPLGRCQFRCLLMIGYAGNGVD